MEKGDGREERWIAEVAEDGKKLEDRLGVGQRPRDAINWGRRNQSGAELAKCPETGAE